MFPLKSVFMFILALSPPFENIAEVNKKIKKLSTLGEVLKSARKRMDPFFKSFALRWVLPSAKILVEIVNRQNRFALSTVGP